MMKKIHSINYCKKLSRSEQRFITGGVDFITQRQCIHYCLGEWDNFLCILPENSPCAGYYA